MFRNQEGPCQVYPLGMGNVDEDITAMLQGSHATLSQASLAGVMAPTDPLTSFPSTQYLHFQGNLSPASATSSPHKCRRQASASSSGQPARSLSISQGFLSNVRTPPAPPSNSNSNSSNNSNSNNSRRVVVPPSAEGWVPNFQADEKWLMDAKSEVLDVAMQQQHRSSDMSSFYDNLNPNLNPAVVPGSLHRYHSAPSAFLQGLAEFNEDAFSSQVSNSMVDSAMPPLFSDGGGGGGGGGGGLTPITEGMDVDRIGSGGSLSEFEQFISPDSDFSRRAAMSALGKPEGNADSFGRNFPAPKSGLLRQKSLPSATLAHAKATRQDRIDEIVSEESISGTSEDNELADNGMKGSASGMFPQDDFLRDTLTSWQSPPSPVSVGPGKRQRGLPGESDTSSGSAEGSITFHAGQPQGGGGGNGLTRHMSLPTNADLTSPDDYVQMRTRAKRGCATHPRSIAERVRRTRISERMRKLQDLVPNMDKQTNTSDMLDETVEYVRSLQMKVKELTDTVAQLKAVEQQKKSIITTA